MSANNKRARKVRAARDMKGRKGPSKTTPKHGKKKAWFQLGNRRVVKQGEGGETVAFSVRTKTPEQRVQA